MCLARQSDVKADVFVSICRRMGIKYLKAYKVIGWEKGWSPRQSQYYAYWMNCSYPKKGLVPPPKKGFLSFHRAQRGRDRRYKKGYHSFLMDEARRTIKKEIFSGKVKEIWVPIESITELGSQYFYAYKNDQTKHFPVVVSDTFTFEQPKGGPKASIRTFEEIWADPKFIKSLLGGK